MAREIINNGTVAGDGTGEILFTAFEKTNSNFEELYSDKIENVVYINSASDFPDAVGNFRELVPSSGAFVKYVIAPNVIDIGNTGFTITDGNVVIEGTHRTGSRITNNGVPMFTCNDSFFFSSEIRYNTDDTWCEFTSDGSHSFATNNVIIDNCSDVALIDGCFISSFINMTITNTNNDGFTWLGSNNQINISNMLALNWSSILLDLGSATFDIINITDGSKFISGNSTTILSGLANNGNLNADGRAIVDGNFFLGTGVAVNGIDTQDSQWLFKSNVFQDGTTLNTQETKNIIICNQENKDTTLGGVIDSEKEYFLDGIIDMGTTQITVPTTGMTIRGYSFDLSGLTSTENNYTMFISETSLIGSGNVLGFDYFITVSGSNSKVYELYDATGFNSIEIQRVNYIDCTSLGDLYNYRQGLETGTGRFGGSPSLTFNGTWLGGYRITTSIVRSMSNSTPEPLFKEGNSFVMNSRFLSDINCDLGALQPFTDFQNSNFANSSTFQLKGCEITRNGVYNADDSNITPNISKSMLASYWKSNNGLPNTYVGGKSTVSTEVTTSVANNTTFYTLAGIFSGSDLEHFSASADGKLTHLGNFPREFQLIGNLNLESTQNNSITVRIRKWDNSQGIFVNFSGKEQTRVVNNLQGGRDIAYFTIITEITLDKDDYVELRVKNETDGNDITAEEGSFFQLKEV